MYVVMSLLLTLSVLCLLKITYLQDFKYWEIFCGLTIEEMEKRENDFQYPPRLKINCKQVGASKSLCSSFKVSKRSKDKEIILIAEFPLDKKVTGRRYTVSSTCIYIHILLCVLRTIYYIP